MAPKKAKKISLNEFLGDSTLGSWADEMDALPSAPAVRHDDDQSGRDRFSRRDDYLSSRPDRASGPPREDLPLPTAPPFTAFVGNLAFDLTEMEMEDFFGPAKIKSVKIIKDREDKPKGFGYIEFEELSGLKDALAKTGSTFSGRMIRVSVAEPPKERERSNFSHREDDSKFDTPWRRDGPLPDLSNSRDSSRRRFDGPREERLPTVSESASDWRSNKPRAPVPESDEGPSPAGSMRRKGTGFSTESAGQADSADTWTMGSKFRPSTEDERNEKDGKFGSLRGRSDMGPPRDPPSDEGDWRGGNRKSAFGRNSSSPSNSTPPTPQMGRRKLELLPKSGNASGASSPLSSPKIGPTPTASASSTRSNPFGSARPVDVTNREKEVSDRIERERETTKERLTMSRTNSRTGVERPPRSPPASVPQTPSSPRHSMISPTPKTTSSVVRPSLSFASAAARKDTPAKVADEDVAGSESVAEVVS